MDINSAQIEAANRLAREVRKSVVTMTHNSQSSHVGSALSVADILCALYECVADIRPDNLSSPTRDVLILSKGHAAAALYAVLAHKRFFPMSWLDAYCTNGNPLAGHVTASQVPGVELSTGSLGHGLPYGVGIALGRKRAAIEGRVIVVMSDGECDEGTTWESALLANHHRLENLLVIIDRNNFQSLRKTEETLKLEPLVDKWISFGWTTEVIDGHNFGEIVESTKKKNGPVVVIANTVKGKGVSFMENTVMWHYKSPSKHEHTLALSELTDTQ